jgi:hypothetical protein
MPGLRRMRGGGEAAWPSLPLGYRPVMAHGEELPAHHACSKRMHAAAAVANLRELPRSQVVVMMVMLRNEWRAKQGDEHATERAPWHMHHLMRMLRKASA